MKFISARQRLYQPTKLTWASWDIVSTPQPGLEMTWSFHGKDTSLNCYAKNLLIQTMSSVALNRPCKPTIWPFKNLTVQNI